MIAISSGVKSPVTVTYQALGGLYEIIDTSALADLINTQASSVRPVSYKNILNPPEAYPPSSHQHSISDVYGFEYLIVALDRIRDAILLTDIPAFEEIVNWVKSRTAGVMDLAEALKNPAVSASNEDLLITYGVFKKYLTAFCECGGAGHKWFNPNSGPVMDRDFTLITVNYPSAAANIKYRCKISMKGDEVITDYFPTGTEIIDLPPFDISGNSRFVVIPIATVTIDTSSPPQFSIDLIDEDGGVLESSGVYNIVPYADYIPDGDYDPHHYQRICCVYQPRIPITESTLYMLEHKRDLIGSYTSPTQAKPLSPGQGGTGGVNTAALIAAGGLYTRDLIDKPSGLAGLDSNGKLNPSILPISPNPCVHGPLLNGTLPPAITKDTTYTFTITNYDSWAVYTASSSIAATVVRVEDVISYTPTSNGTHELIVNGKHFTVGTI
jgi:hypothetical protein